MPFSTDGTRGTLAALARSRTLLVALAVTVILALVGTTWGYAALSRTVTLSLDGETREVTVLGGTVEDVLEAEGIELGEHDRVLPGLDQGISDGSRVNVKFGRPVELSVDGEEETHWVTATDVDSALAQIGQRFLGADLSASRGAGIGRDGLALEVVTPKRLTLAIAGKKPVKRELTVLTVREALRELGVKVERRDVVKPAVSSELEDGDRLLFTDLRVVEKRVKDEAIAFSTVERTDSSMLEGRTEVVRSGRAGVRDVTYRIVFRNGELVRRAVVRQEVLRQPVNTVVSVGTKEKPAPAPAPVVSNFASGGTVWDQLAACESGGNWATNTGNGYYGGLQFSLSTWRSYGGAGYPHQQSREYQISIAERLRAATGGYGSWPHCSQSLGLPQ